MRPVGDVEILQCSAATPHLEPQQPRFQGEGSTEAALR